MAGDSMRTDEREHPAKPQKSAVFRRLSRCRCLSHAARRLNRAAIAARLMSQFTRKETVPWIST
jgi:hypothetical protein